MRAAGTGTLPSGCPQCHSPLRTPGQKGNAPGHLPTSIISCTKKLKRSITYNLYGAATSYARWKSSLKVYFSVCLKQKVRLKHMGMLFHSRLRDLSLSQGEKKLWAWFVFPFSGGRISPMLSHIVSEMLLFISTAGLSRDLLLL